MVSHGSFFILLLKTELRHGTAEVGRLGTRLSGDTGFG